jgi:endonuclease V-like protein UPF0215 family
MPDPSSEQIQIPLVWVEHDDPRIRWVNQFQSQFQPDEFVVSFGQAVPPAVRPGSEDEIRSQVEQIQFVPAHTVAKIALNRHKMVELIRILQENLAAHDQAMEQNR